jgi:hypothetical protein
LANPSSLTQLNTQTEQDFSVALNNFKNSATQPLKAPLVDMTISEIQDNASTKSRKSKQEANLATMCSPRIQNKIQEAQTSSEAGTGNACQEVGSSGS